jgi:hypothetical protein
MCASWDQVRCLKQLINERELFVCHICSSKTFIVEDAFWASKGTPSTPLWVKGRCAECDQDSPFIILSVEDAKRCGFSDPDIG